MRRRRRQIEEAKRTADQLAANTEVIAQAASIARSQNATLAALRRQSNETARLVREIHAELCPKKKNPSSSAPSNAASRSSRRRVSESIERSD